MLSDPEPLRNTSGCRGCPKELTSSSGQRGLDPVRFLGKPCLGPRHPVLDSFVPPAAKDRIRLGGSIHRQPRITRSSYRGGNHERPLVRGHPVGVDKDPNPGRNVYPPPRQAPV